MSFQEHYAQFEAYNAAYFLVLGKASTELAAQLRVLAFASHAAYLAAWREACSVTPTPPAPFPLLTDEAAPTYKVVGEVFQVSLPEVV